tara:strand:- start:24895 stop:25710 length:816 start_codon:yes stop_codon:yes gene_type:complete
MNLQEYSANFPSLTFAEPKPGILEVIFDSESPVNSMDARMHHDAAYVWQQIDRDSSVLAVLVRGEGKGFSAGGDLALVKEMVENDTALLNTWKECKDLVYNMINCSKPIVSAIHGPAVGAGLAVALLADIPIAERKAKLIDSHTRLGVAAGDVAAIIWPLLCGMAKAKYFLLTGKAVSGEEAERIGLVALCVDQEALYATALDTACEVAQGSPSAVRWTKHALNNWLREMGSAFDHSLALEILGFRLPDIREGLDALTEKRPPEFDTRCDI